MGGYEFVFIFGSVIGALVGWWFGRISLLGRMHKEDVENAHANYKKRKDKYLGKKD
jgi:membrane protein YqaA with SNARE-associated domain